MQPQVKIPADAHQDIATQQRLKASLSGGE